MIVRFEVSFELPRAATLAVARRYVEDAVRTMAGALTDDDPMCYTKFDTSTVDVQYVKPA